jgi:DNA-binding MarR family transcriptional regulator
MASRDRTDGILASLLRLSRALEAALREGAGELGLTPAQAETLRFAGRIRPDMATVGQLARVLGVRHATAVGICEPLVERGLVERRPHPYDGRRRVLALTRRGRALLARLDRITAALRESLAGLDPASLEHLELGLGALVAGLRRTGALVVAAPCAGCVHFRPNAAPGTAAPHRCALIERYLLEAESRMLCPEHTPAA